MASTDHHSFRRHVAVLDYPFTSHSFANHALARLLASAAPDVLFSFLGTAKSNATIAAIPSPPNLTLYAVSDSIPGVPSSSSLFEEAKQFLKAAPGNLMEGINRAVREGGGGAKITCILTDSFMAKFVRKMAEEMSVPWIALRTGSACSLSVYVYSDVIRRTIGIGDNVVGYQADRDLSFIPTLSALTVRELPDGVVGEVFNHPVPLLLRQMGQELPGATAVAVNTFEELEVEIIADLSTKLKKILPVGPLNLLSSTMSPAPDPFNCLSWLNRQQPASVAYVSFGTVASPSSTELASLAQGLEASGSPFIWSLKEKFHVHLPEGFVDRTMGRGLVVSWAPQVDILNDAATGVFITHCGWKSVIESLTAGVPMICRPICFDQKMNAKQVANLWGVGLMLDNDFMSKDSVMNSLETVLAREEGKKMRDKARAFKELAMKAVEPSGSSMKSLSTIIDIVRA